MVGRGTPRSPVLAVWARLELSVIVWMVLGVVLSARPLLEASTEGIEAALSTTATVFSAFMMGELVGMAAAAWFRGTGAARVVRALASVVGVACAIAAVTAVTPASRAVSSGLLGACVELVAALTVDASVRSPLLRRTTELVALAATCAAVVAIGAGILLVAAGPPQGIWAFAVCGAGQAAVVLITVVYALFPPGESELPLA